MGQDVSGPGAVHISEPFFMEWVEKGLKDLAAYLAFHARFAAWCAANHREADECQP